MLHVEVTVVLCEWIRPTLEAEEEKTVCRTRSVLRIICPLRMRLAVHALVEFLVRAGACTLKYLARGHVSVRLQSI